jgi:HKD family nuclease
MFLSPLIGSLIYEKYHSKYCFDVVFICDLAFGLFIGAFNCGLNVFRENREFNIKLNQLRGEEMEEPIETS